jgi:ribosomal protein S18 acetylase RimI-like enzyme
MKVRDFRRPDVADMKHVLAAAAPTRRWTTVAVRQHMEQILGLNGRIWIGVSEGRVVAYLAVTPVPGLPHVVEMEGSVLPAVRQQGWGRQLLHHCVRQLHGSDVQQLSFPVASLQSSAALFLLANHFFVEHEERTLQLTADALPMALPPEPPPGCSVQLLNRRAAILQFCRLYDRCFVGTPWNQPFTEEEVTEILQQPEDMRFLMENGRPVGFVWVQAAGGEEEGGETAVQLEPVGIVPERQCQGYGRYLLSHTLYTLQQQNRYPIHITTWATNQPALHLYHSFGFTHISTLYYLAYNLPQT